MDFKEKSYIAPKPPEKQQPARQGRIEVTSSKDMSFRSLFNLILKVLGIFFLKDILASLSQTVSVFVYLPKYESAREAYYNIALNASPLLVYAVFSWLLIFKTNWVMNILRLDRHFGKELIPMRLHRSAILTIAVIVIGGLQLANEIPEFCRYVMYYVQERKLYTRMAKPDLSYIFMSIVKMCIGLFLLMYNRLIVNFIEYGRKNGPNWRWSLRRTKNKE